MTPRRFAIRWALVYLVLYFSEVVPALLPVIAGNLSLQVHVFDAYSQLWAALPLWLGVYVLGVRPSAMAQLAGPSPFLFCEVADHGGDRRPRRGHLAVDRRATEIEGYRHHHRDDGG